MIADGTKPKVLFIDDDPMMHALYKPHIGRAGYDVIGLLEAGEALEVARGEHPSVIVIDMILPGQDGLATILVLKASEVTRKIPIIAISANSSLEGSRQQLEKIGADVFLTKPFGAAKLVGEICRLAATTDETIATPVATEARPGRPTPGQAQMAG